MLERAAEQSERVLVERDGKVVGAFISLEDLRFFEDLEDANDHRHARANVEASRRAGEPNVSLQDARARSAEKHREGKPVASPAVR